MQTKTTDKKLVLKILSGPHLGAEILLSNGEYILGTSDECDIILSDHSISEKHVKITVKESKVSIKALENGLYIDGETQTQEAQVKNFQVITIGTTNFAIGPAEEKWPELNLSGFPPKKPEHEGENKQSAQEINDGETVSDPPTTPPEEASDGFIKQHWRLLSIAGGALILFFVVFIIMLGASSSSSNINRNPEKTLEKLKVAVSKLQLPGIHLSRDNAGIITIEGYVRNKKEKKDLQEMATKYAPEAKIRVIVTSQLEDACRESLSALGFQLPVTANIDGTVVIRGVVKNSSSFNKAVQILKQDVPGIEKIECHVLAYSEIIPTFQRILENLNFKGQVDFKTYPDRILAQGMLNKKDMKIWREAKKQFCYNYGANIPITENFGKDKHNTVEKQLFENPLRTKPVNIPFSITSVTVGAISYITANDGCKYFEGARLKNGFTIVDIKPDRILLERNREKHIYYLRGE